MQRLTVLRLELCQELSMPAGYKGMTLRTTLRVRLCDQDRSGCNASFENTRLTMQMAFT